MCSETIYGQGYYRRRPRVLVVGLGGGPDLQCALYNEARAIDVVEINRDSIAAVRGPFDRWLGGIGSDPRVRFHERDGRSFIRSRSEPLRPDPAERRRHQELPRRPALALSENHLYTLEAFRDYFDGSRRRAHLDHPFRRVRGGAPRGDRHGRAARVRRRRPRRHIAVGNDGLAYGVLRRKQPWNDAEAERSRSLLHPPHFRGAQSTTTAGAASVD